MSRPTSYQGKTQETEQAVLNNSVDPDFDVLAVETLEYDPAGNLKRKTTSNLATRIVESGNYIYIGKATIGSATSSAVWQVKRVDTTSGAVILWADGDDSFDNVFDDYSSLSYS